MSTRGHIVYTRITGKDRGGLDVRPRRRRPRGFRVCRPMPQIGRARH